MGLGVSKNSMGALPRPPHASSSIYEERVCGIFPVQATGLKFIIARLAFVETTVVRI